MIKDNTVFVGNKPVMNYVLAVVTQFNNGAEEVAIRHAERLYHVRSIRRRSHSTALANVVKKRSYIDRDDRRDTGKTNVSASR